MHSAGHGVRITLALTNTIVSLAGFAFVDDTDLFCAGPVFTTTAGDLSAEFQNALNRWSGGLQATGGALAPLKSFCYLLDFKWSGSSWNYASIADLPGDFTLTTPQGDPQPLRRYEPSHAEKTLGVFISMDGNEQAEIAYLKRQCIPFGAKIEASTCTKNEDLYTLSLIHI